MPVLPSTFRRKHNRTLTHRRLGIPLSVMLQRIPLVSRELVR